MNTLGTIPPGRGLPRAGRKKPAVKPPALPSHLDFPAELPITRRKEDIIQAIKDNPVVIISGATGSGKTTQIPKFCIAAGRGRLGRIGCTQPRRIAAVNVARRIAEELHERIGQSVGYKIRFDDTINRQTCIKIMTDGILLAETQSDPQLKEYDTLIVDEAHERSLNIDFTLGLLRRLIRRRKDMKLIITSATIDTDQFSRAFDHAPVIEVSGRMFPVDILYRPYLNPSDPSGDPDDQGYVEAAADSVLHLLSTTRAGDILVFMPTEQDIGETLELIRSRRIPGVTVLPLFARLSAREQSRIFSRPPGRKIIIATNVAETSLTIPGIKYVVDTGLARIPSYSPRTRTTALPVSPVSQSSANQRAGRCGRVENGVCIRLYDEDDFNGRPYFTPPEILRSNLAEVILKMMALGLGDVAGFPFIDPPAPKSIQDGFATLIELGAIRERRRKEKQPGRKSYHLTDIGQIMARLPIDPRLSRILLEADRLGCLAEAAVITTALAVSDPRQRPMEKTQAADQKHALFKDPSSDFVTLLNIWQAVQKARNRFQSRSGLKTFCRDHFLSFKRIREWNEIHDQILTILKENGINGDTPLPAAVGTKGLKAKAFELGGPLYIALHQALLTGCLAHIAHKKEKNMFTAAKGQQVMIFPGSGLFDDAGQWIVAAEFVKTSQVFARTVAKIDPDWLEPIGRDLCAYSYSDPHWEKSRGEVVALEQVALFGLIIVSGRRKAYGKVNPEEAGDIFIRHALVQEEIAQKFPFMIHNRELMASLETMEHKTRKKDILASEEDIFMFYKSRLPRPFSDIRTFARFLKENNDPDFLKMTLSDLQKSDVDEQALALYPDTLATTQGRFPLEYRFTPGSGRDGVTLKVPVAAAPFVPIHHLGRLVPGLFEEKVTALIKALPKRFRTRLMPVSEKAALIAAELPKSDRPLFSLLSAFIRERFGIQIPETAWSDQDLPEHLKMRISIRDEKGREIKASRDPSLLTQLVSQKPGKEEAAFEKARQGFERSNIRAWDFPDLDPCLSISMDDQGTLNAYPGLSCEADAKTREIILCLRLFRSQRKAQEAHLQGIRHLFTLCFPEDFKALKNDIRSFPGLTRVAPFFDGRSLFQTAVFDRITRTLFARDIRTRKDFDAHARDRLPRIYEHGREFMKIVCALGDIYQSCFERLQKLSFQHRDRKKTAERLTGLFNELKNLVPPNFLDLYTEERIRHLPRFVDGLRIRAQRIVDHPLKEEKKAQGMEKYSRCLTTFLSSLSQDSSPAKTRQVENFFWLLEEYKIALFTPELKTSVKVSEKILDRLAIDISQMI